MLENKKMNVKKNYFFLLGWMVFFHLFFSMLLIYFVLFYFIGI